ncbi:MAG: M48 family metalloprotease [Azoarcus sp.]|jgi:putative metalloprotease|nr:M48 family metalloprotease [Azoarcus sp.]
MNRRLVACAGLLAASIQFSGCTTADAVNMALVAAPGVINALTVSDEDVKSSSLKAMVQMDQKNKVPAQNNAYARRLANLTKDFVHEDGMNLNFKVYMADEVNAFATPDGSIRVYSGLMDLMTDDELRSVLGHEMGHVKLGHSLKEARTAYLSHAGAAAASTAGGTLGQLVGALGESLVNAQYSQAQESEADAFGVAFLKRHNFNLPAAESAMRKLAKLDGTDKGGKGSMFASHPGSKQRADRIHQLITQK